MKKISVSDVENALARDELRAIKGGSGIWCGVPRCSSPPPPYAHKIQDCCSPTGQCWGVYNMPFGACFW